jgi:hypothetical protein
MNITTNNFTYPTGSVSFIKLDCTDSVCAESVNIVIYAKHCKSATVLVTYKNGDQWGYEISDLMALMVGLGLDSVGRFVSTVVKPLSTFSSNLKREAVGV